MNKKTSWDYQKNNYKQINIKFDMRDPVDALLYHYLTDKTVNASKLIKSLVNSVMWEDAYNEE